MNFQTYVDHSHEGFVSGKQACIDPPHLRMVFDEAVVDRLLETNPALALKVPIEHAQQQDGQLSNQEADSAAAAGSSDDRAKQWQSSHSQATFHGDVQHADESSQHRDAGSQVVLETEQQALETPAYPGTWQEVLQQSMQRAKDIRWTHKGLQVTFTLPAHMSLPSDVHSHMCTNRD